VATGSISKQERISEIRLERRMLNRRDLLILRRDICNGCGICVEVCPKDALNMKPAVTKNGSLLRLPVIEIDEEKCVMCGICVALCPLGALEAWVNDEKIAMFVENEAIPSMMRSVTIDKGLCRPDCGLKCEESCPRDAIKVNVERENCQVKKINDVQVDDNLCIYCKVCEYACPYGAIAVEKTLEGSVIVDTEKCPPNCRICIQVCPSNAITLEGGGLVVHRELCIFCKACEKVCPEEAVHVNIERASHTPIKSAIWINILERFASYKTAAKELDAKARWKQKSLFENRLLQVKPLLRLLYKEEK
jgi:4Fe-4S ferredoxin